MHSQCTALDFLGYGMAIRARVKRDRTTVRAVADDAGIRKDVAIKAHWLAGVYDSAAQRRLGRKVLAAISPMHLEVVATCSATVREDLLREAADADLTARQLRKLARARRDAGADGSGTIASLRNSTRAMEQYASFDDRALQILLGGPNGPEVRRAASAGQTLAARLASTPS